MCGGAKMGQFTVLNYGQKNTTTISQLEKGQNQQQQHLFLDKMHQRQKTTTTPKWRKL